jgi:CheY-like chemotaxis protein
MDKAARVLVVDDDPTARLVLRHNLEGRGYEVTEAQDGLQAVRVASTDPPDCILLDYLMPRLDGSGALRLLRDHGALRRTPVVVLTGFPGRERRDAFASLGAAAVLIKPFSFEALHATLEEVLVWRLSRN